VSATGAILNGTVNPADNETNVYFEYGTTIAYGMTTGTQAIGSGTSDVPVSAVVSGLAGMADTTYHFRIVETSTAGTFYGADQTFTTPGLTHTVVLKGSPATGFSGAVLSTLGQPAMSDHGYVAFSAKVNGWVSSSNNLGVWADDGSGTRQLVIQTGTGAPDVNGAATSAVFKKFSDPVYNGNNAVAFVGTLTQGVGGVGAANDTGVWSNDGGTLHLVAQEGTPATSFKTFKQIALPDTGGPLVFAKGADGKSGIWAGGGASQQLVVREGSAIPGTSGTVKTLTFLPAAANVTGQTRCFDSAGDLLYGVKFTSGTTAIYKATLGSGTYTHTLVAAQNDAATGVAGAKFASFGNPTMNELGQVAFAAKMGSVWVTTSSNLGIWADGTNGVRQLVVRSGTTAPDAAGTGSVGVFKKFSDPVYSGSSAVAFIGTLVQGGATTVSNDTGVWSNDGGTLRLVAREGGQASGCAAGVTFKTFTQIALPDQGGVVMFAKLGGTGVGSSNDMAIFAVDTGGTLQLIAREGTTHAVTGKTIKTLSFLPAIAGVSGQTRGFSQTTGDLVYSATFTDGSAGIFKVVFP
jgi:hypothetical protein